MESLPAIFFESNKIGRGEVATKIPTSHGVYPSFEESNLRPGPTSSTPYAGIWDTSQPISACGWRWRCGFPTDHWLISSPETSTETWIDSSKNNSTPSELMHSLEVKLPLSCGKSNLDALEPRLPQTPSASRVARDQIMLQQCKRSCRWRFGALKRCTWSLYVTVAVSSSSFGTFGCGIMVEWK